MSSQTITQFSEVIATVVRLAEENPDRTSDDEYFNHDGEPCCIFGHAFHILGITEEQVDAATETEYSIADLDLHVMGIGEVRDEQMYWAARVQKAQDRGATWQDAVTRAGSVPA